MNPYNLDLGRLIHEERLQDAENYRMWKEARAYRANRSTRVRPRLGSALNSISQKLGVHSR